MPTKYDSLKVESGTKERLRYVAAIEDRAQYQVLDEALAEYIERHADRFRAGIDRMTAVLRRGDRALAAHMTGLGEEDLARLEGR
jgi:predicted transcriptional regulator